MPHLGFHLGPLEITGFGIAVLLAFVIAQIISQQELLRRGYPKEAEAIPDLIIACVVGTLIGGRLYYAGIVQQDWSALWGRAGFVFWGGFIGSVIATGLGAAAASAYAFRRKLKQRIARLTLRDEFSATPPLRPHDPAAAGRFHALPDHAAVRIVVVVGGVREVASRIPPCCGRLMEIRIS